MSGKEFVWTTFYMEFADKLLTYKNDRGSLIEAIKRVYDNIGVKLPKLESGELLDIDPFTVYGLFNKGISDQSRTAILKGFASEWNLQSEVPEVFPGIPVVNNMAATFYAFQGDSRRKADDIDNLWEVFDAAIELAEDDYTGSTKRFEDAYNKALKQYAVKWNLTMGLYWIRPYHYLNLDSRNRWFIVDWKGMPDRFIEKIKPLIKSVPKGEDYLHICYECMSTLELGELRYRTIPELSKYAWDESERVNEKGKNWGPSLEEYNPGLTKEDWLNVLNNPDIIGREWGGLLAAFYMMPDGATCTQIAQNYNTTAFSISGMCTQLAKRVHKETNCPLYSETTDKEQFWPILFFGKKVGAKSIGTYSWKLRPELYDALSEFDIMQFEWETDGGPIDPLGDDNVQTKRYWLYAPGDGASMWDKCYAEGIMVLGWDQLGDYETYASKEDVRQKLIETSDSNSSQKNAAHAVWQFAHEMSPGDVVIVKRGRSEVLGKGVVESDYYYDPDVSEEYPNIRKVNWTQKGQWPHPGQAVMKTLTDMTPYTDYVERLLALFDETVSEDDDDTLEVAYPSYTEEDFLSEVFMTEQEYNSLVGLIRNKKNVILQGAPGVGKTFAARRLAYSMMGEKDRSRVQMVQFHQSYSYEDFIMGFRPTETGFELKKGAFYNFCKDAEIDSDNEYFFIIDEINRGNLSKIFGELFMLIENDKRGVQLQLLYSNEKFSVPKNVYIIGMMNTADRSLAMLDYALRRRFAFYEMAPGFETDGFKDYQYSLESEKFNRLIDCVKELNVRIANDDSLGEGFCIGHSYFCNLKEASDGALDGIVKYELVPLLKEYWFDEPSKVKEWTDRLKRAIS